MNKLDISDRVRILQSLVEGCSLRATNRMVGVSINTVTKLLVDAGTACLAYQDKSLRGLAPKRIQCDEIWSFCYSKQKNVPAEHAGEFGFGDVWTWVALDADSKLAITWRIGLRTGDDAREFMLDLADRVVDIAQLTTDGFNAYPEAVQNAFGNYVDFAQLIKVYRSDRSGEARYSPAVCVGCKSEAVIGAPDPAHVSTSYVERQNLTMRMAMRRFTRLTNAFAKKVENSAHAVALHFMHYNFIRTHKTLKTTPAIAGGLTDRIWSFEDVIGLIDGQNSN